MRMKIFFVEEKEKKENIWRRKKSTSVRKKKKEENIWRRKISWRRKKCCGTGTGIECSIRGPRRPKK